MKPHHASSVATSAQHRRRDPHLDPYAMSDCTLTLEEWRRQQRVVRPVHVVRYQEDTTGAAAA